MRQLRRGRAQRLDGARRERGGDQLADPRVLGRLEAEQVQRSVSQNACRRGSSGSAAQLVLAADVTEVAAEPPVAQACAHLGVPGDEPAVERCS